MKNYIIIHGRGSDIYSNWYPWLYKNLIEKGEECYVPSMPTGECQNYKAWKKVLEGYLEAGIINSQTIFICHSVASVFVTRFIIEERINVTGVIAVAGFNSETMDVNHTEQNKTFLTKSKKLERVMRNIKFYHCIYSSSDPYIAFDKLNDYAKIFGAKTHEIENAGHFEEREFPYLLELVDKINTIV